MRKNAVKVYFGKENCAKLLQQTKNPHQTSRE